MYRKSIPKIQKVFILNLRYLRNLKNLSQKQLSDKLSISTVHLNNIENGKSFPSIDLLEKICIVLEITPKQLFEQ